MKDIWPRTKEQNHFRA